MQDFEALRKSSVVSLAIMMRINGGRKAQWRINGHNCYTTVTHKDNNKHLENIKFYEEQFNLR